MLVSKRPSPAELRMLRALREAAVRNNGQFVQPKDLVKMMRQNPSMNTVYTSLRRLAERKLASRRKARKGSAYRITAVGQHVLETVRSGRPWSANTALRSSCAKYLILRSLREAGAAQVFLADVQLTNGAPPAPQLRNTHQVVVKSVSNSICTEFLATGSTDIARYLNYLNELFDAERPKLEQLNSLSCVAPTLDWGQEELFFGGESSLRVVVPFLVQELINGPDLAAYLQARTARPFSGVDKLDDFFALAEQLVQGLKDTHAVDVFLRRISPWTIYMRGDAPVFVDLGEAVLQGALAIAGLSRSDSSADTTPFVAPELRGSQIKPARRADLYSLGATLFYAATGRPPNFEGIVDPEDLKRSITQALSSTVANKNFGVADIISQCLRVSPDDRVPDAYTLLRTVRTFRSRERESASNTAIRLASRFETIVRQADRDVFASLAAVEFEHFEQVLEELQTGSVIAAGGHNKLVIKLCSYLSTLERGAEYWAVTVPAFWWPRNLGIRGRYLSMNGEIVRRGACVKRVFLVTPEDAHDLRTRDVIEAHIDLARRLDQLRDAGEPVTGKLDARFLEVSAQQRRDAINNGEQIGLWIRDDSLVTVKAIYSQANEITRVHISRVPSNTTKTVMKATWFDRFFEEAQPLHLWQSRL